MNPTSTATTVPVRLGQTPTAIDPYTLVSIAAWVLFVLWILYTLIAAYHWFRYGHRSPVAIPALTVHVIVSLALALYAVSGFAGT